MRADLKGVLRHLVDVASVLAAMGYVASFFPAALVGSVTTPAGGDTASHFYPVQYLLEVLLPAGQLMGWCPGNYAGYPLFQLYFPLPFMVMSLLSTWFPLEVAFKLTTILGVLLLPPACYVSLRLLRVPFPGPALGALASLCFLFMEANSMWGGNIPSMLAGEFSYSYGLALAILSIGSLAHTARTGRGLIANGVLVALIGLSHGYALLFAGFASLLHLVTTEGWWRRVRMLCIVHGLAILLMGFWLIPLLWYSPWATAYAHIWGIESWREAFPPILWPAMALAFATLAGHGLVSRLRKAAFPEALALLCGSCLVAVVAYGVAPAAGVVDIRFLAFLQLGICLIAAAGLGLSLQRVRFIEVIPVLAALVTILSIQASVKFIPDWVDWNYSGFERKVAWSKFKELNDHLTGDFRDPRVFYEHSNQHDQFGSTRAFENLPLFSGRSTLEGLYMQSSATAPFVFYLQSELSESPSCPLPQWGCSRLDVDRGIEHLRMFNVSQFIAQSAALKKRLAEHPDLIHEMSVEDYSVYRVRGNDGRYAIPLAQRPVFIRTDDWKTSAYRWFKRSRTGDPMPVFAGALDDDDVEYFAAAYDELPDSFESVKVPAPAPVRESLGVGRIHISGTTPGDPVLVKISYHPRWRTAGGERIWLAGPNFMLVFPKSDSVELVFDSGPVLGAGRVASALGILACLLSLTPIRRRLEAPVGRLWAGWSAWPPLAMPITIVRRSEGWSAPMRRRLLDVSLGCLLLALAGLVAFTSKSDVDRLYREGQALYAAGRLSEALPYFQEAKRVAPLSNSANHARYFEAIIHYRQEEWETAEALFSTLVQDYPEAPSVAESRYHIGLCRARLGDREGAMRAWHETILRFPRTDWASYANERLSELN